MSRFVHRLTRWQRLWLYATGCVLLVSGVSWLALHYLVGAGAGDLPHPFEAWLMRLHGLAGFAALFFFGVLAGHHIPHGWRLSARHRYARQRGSGVMLGALAGSLALTGYALYYFAPEGVRPAMGWVHSGFGVAMAGLVLSHRRGSRPD